MNKKSQILSTLIILALFILAPNFSLADTLGQRETFFVDSSFDKYDRSQVSATLRYVSDKLYFYVEEDYWDDLDTSHQNSLIDRMATLTGEFEHTIYPKETQFWGSEPNPGIDGDPRITILVQPLVTGNGGYFNSGNQYTRDQVAESNVREMIYLNAEVVSSKNDYTRAFLAHEFQHLLSFNQKWLINKAVEDAWLNELRSEHSISVVGYNDIYSNSSLSRRVHAFLENPSDSLTEWPNETSDYAIASVFSEYLVEQYGISILSETLRMPAISINSINNFLQTRGYSEKFGDIFLRWMAAVYLNDINLDSDYGYVRPELQDIKVSPQQSVSLSSELSDYVASHAVKDWQPLWLEYDFDNGFTTASKSIKIEINGQSDQNFLISYITFFSDGSKRVDRLPVTAGRGAGYASNINSGIKKIAVLATDGTKLYDFNNQESKHSFSVKISSVDASTVEASVIKDGALIKRPLDKEIYVIWGKYKRYLVPGVIALYGHLNPANAIDTFPEIFNSYTTSNYVKYINDPKVYTIWPDGTKHWLNITPQQWDASGRDWNSIFIINDLELNYYKTGADITR